MATAEDVVREVARQADRTVRLIDAPGRKTMRAMVAMLKEADQAHIGALLRLLKGLGGPDATFTAASAVAYRQVNERSVLGLMGRLLRLLRSSGTVTMAAALRRHAEMVRDLDEIHLGRHRPRRITQAAMMSQALRGTKASLLGQHGSSVRSYGRQMISSMEKEMRVGMLNGKSQYEMVGELQTYTKERWRAWRIVRTECANAYGAVTQASLEEDRREGEPTLKKILAHFDNRTAPDSVYVHGQIRPVDGLFVDGAGRRYRHPPARPNDRETVIPWYADDWTEDSFSRPKPPRERALAKLDMMPAKYRPSGQAETAFLDSLTNALRANPDL